MGKRRVILAGAGTSVEFGLPSGEAIFDLFDKMGPPPPQESWNERALLASFYAFCGKVDPTARASAEQCIEEIKRNGAGSIDLFAYHREDYARVAKLMTSWALFKKMAEAQTRCVKRTFSLPVQGPGGSTTTVPVRNWLTRVFREYAGTARTSDELRPDELTFVTFNYDQLIERGMTGFIKSAWPNAQPRVVPRVIHVHGGFNAPLSFNSDTIAAQAASIKFLQETRGTPTEAVSEARAALRAADDIYCAGFAFDRLNVELLELGERSPRIFALNYDGNAGLNAYLHELGIAPARIWSPSPGGRMSVGAAADQGFFGQSTANSFWDPPRYS